MVREVLVFKDNEAMAEFAIEKWEEISQGAIDERGYFTVALSGGRSPVLLYEKLSAAKELKWDQTHIFMVDERFVPYESDWNNYRMITETLLRRVNIPEVNLHPILTEEVSMQASAEKYEEDLISFFTTLPRFDLIVLGIGMDGHTASLFQGTSAVSEKKRLVVPVPLTGAAMRYERVTMTFPLLNNAENVMFFVNGADKAEFVREVIKDENSSLPAAMVKPKSGKLIFVLDKGVASLLTREQN